MQRQPCGAAGGASSTALEKQHTVCTADAYDELLRPGWVKHDRGERKGLQEQGSDQG